MTDQKTFPPQKEGHFCLSEGGAETEILYKYGFELPQFAMFPLLNNPEALSKLQGMYRCASNLPKLPSP
jgi:homocysteine S-methyltransferase